MTETVTVTSILITGITALGGTIVYLFKEMKKERKEAADRTEKQFDIMNNLQKDTTHEINKSNILMTEIATIIKQAQNK